MFLWTDMIVEVYVFLLEIGAETQVKAQHVDGCWIQHFGWC